MAGDWIKMRVDLVDDPSVISIACANDLSEDEVIGKLYKLWSWADRHTSDGVAPGITERWVDKYTGKSGFAVAMAAVKWIKFTDSGVEFPNFDRHNGKSAKTRADSAIRQRLSRENRDNGVTGMERENIPRPFYRHVLNRDGYRCVFCGTQSSEDKEKTKAARLSIDHLIPTTRGGRTAIPNLVCACRLCNGEKNDRTPEEWGLLPTFLQPGVIYEDGEMKAGLSQDYCDENNSTVTAVHFESSDQSREEQSREDKEPPATASPSLVARFEAFWNQYPRKKSKGDAERAFAKVKAAEFETIMTALNAAKVSPEWLKEGGTYIPYPASWLNAKGWLDERPANLATQSAPVKTGDPDRWRKYLKIINRDYIEYKFAFEHTKSDFHMWEKIAA